MLTYTQKIAVTLDCLLKPQKQQINQLLGVRKVMTNITVFKTQRMSDKPQKKPNNQPSEV